jgi:hypothetical protein
MTYDRDLLARKTLCLTGAGAQVMRPTWWRASSRPENPSYAPSGTFSRRAERARALYCRGKSATCMLGSGSTRGQRRTACRRLGWWEWG